jgi:uncharacterized membrane protein SirB2
MAGRGPAPHMFRRVAGFIFFLMLGGAAIGAIVATGLAAVNGTARWLIVGFTVVGLILFVVLTRSLFRRTWAPSGS